MPKLFEPTRMKRYFLACAWILSSCSKALAPVADQPQVMNEAAKSEDEGVLGSKTGAMPQQGPSPAPPVSMKTAEEIAAEKANADAVKAQQVKDATAGTLERVPEGCTGKGTVSDKDVILFNGENVKFDSVSKSIPISRGWRIDESWGNGRIGAEKKRNQTALFFDNETFFHGFKITPPSVKGQRKTFTIKGFDVYYDSSKATTATFGIRLIKPGEYEGLGEFEKRSWFKLDAAGAGKDADLVNATIDGGNCKLVHFYTSKAFLDQNLVSNRFIWELIENWQPADKLYVYKIVLKDFQWK